MFRASALFASPKSFRPVDTQRMVNFPWSGGHRTLINIASDFSMIAIIESGQVNLWDVTKLPEEKTGSRSEIPALTFLPHPAALTASSLSDSRIATASRDSLIIWDEKFKKLKELKLSFEDCSQIHLRELSKENILAIGLGQKNELELIDVNATPHQLAKKIKLPNSIIAAELISQDHLITVDPAIGIQLLKINLKKDQFRLEPVKTFPLTGVSSVLVLSEDWVINQNHALFLYKFDGKKQNLEKITLIADQVFSSPAPHCVAGNILFAPKDSHTFRATLIEAFDLTTQKNRVVLGPCEHGITSCLPTCRGIVLQFDVTPLMGLSVWQPLQEYLQNQKKASPRP